MDFPIDVALSDNLLYVCGDHEGLYIFDVANRTNLVLKSQRRDFGPAQYIAVRSNTAYLGTSTKGCQVLDVSNPSLPLVVTNYPTPPKAVIESMAFAGNFLLLGIYPKQFEIVDVSDPRNPVHAGSMDLAFDIHDFAVKGHYAYAATFGAGVAVIDFEDPLHPQLVTNVLSQVYFPISVALFGNRLYAGTVNDPLPKGVPLLELDVTDPRKPVLASVIEVGDSIEQHVVNGGGRLFLGDGDGPLQVFNVETGGKPHLVGKWFPGRAIKPCVTDSTLFFVYQGINALALDLPANPQRLGEVAVDGGTTLAASGHYAYAGTGENWHIIDASNPFSPRLQVSNALPRLSGFVRVDRLGVGLNAGRLMVYDLWDESRPILLGESTNLPGSGPLAASLTRAFVGQSKGFACLDLSDPASPRLVGSYTNMDTPKSMSLAGNYLYTAVNGLILVFDVSNLENPGLVSTVDTGARINFMQLAKENLYLFPVAPPGLKVYSLADPAQPRLSGTSSTNDFWPRAVVVGNYVYGQQIGVTVFDVSDPAHIKVVGGNPLAGRIGIAAAGDAIYTLGRYGVLDVFPLFDTQPAYRPHHPARDQAGFHFSVWGIPGSEVTIQKTSAPGVWSDWMPVTFGDEPVEIIDSPSASQQFYRVHLP
ncbi:MAG TPA: hypothetical protein VMF06_13570 [Candidatus Limnocylindria bacterium]|nr:hypothetical protein [Candidatus Limnocylindria bacterium]